MAWFVGGLLGVIIEGLPTLPVPAISFFIMGVFVAADLNLSRNSITAIVIVVGLVNGVLI
jgi:hydrogenase/urease accessory protein HupE